RGVLLASYPLRPLDALEDTGATALWEEQTLIDAALVDTLHRAGRRIYGWTVNDPDDMRRLVALQVDGLCGNFPDVARRIVDGAGPEAVVADLGVKQRLFAELERAAPDDALLATNTSSLSVAAIASGMRRPGRLVGMHFFNPVHVMKLVEVIQSPGADRAAVDRAVELARVFGKEPIVVRDSPGFASSRLGLALGLEAMRMLEQGVGSAEDIDRAMELGYNQPMGPLKLTDLVGLDVLIAIAEHLYRTLEEPQFEPPRILPDTVPKG